jgi:hypothetical protein
MNPTLMCLDVGTTDSQTVDLQGGLTDTYRHALTFLATGTDTAIQLHVMPFSIR